MGIIGKPEPPAREDFYMDYENTEEVVNLWHEGPNLWREERWTLSLPARGWEQLAETTMDRGASPFRDGKFLSAEIIQKTCTFRACLR
jgi:hypothetical protein